MEWYLVLLLLMVGLVVLMVTGLPVAFCFILINIVLAYFLWSGEIGLQQLAIAMWMRVANFIFLPIPMFILLGEIVFRSGMATRAIDVVDKWLGRLPGRLGLLTVAMSTLFSTLSGTGLATTAMMGAVMVPEMERHGYKKSISIGCVMGTGGLSTLIPPSALGVLWACIAQVSVGKLLIAGVIPGLVMAGFYAIYVVGRCLLQPSVAPAYAVTPTPLSKKLKGTAKYVLPLSIIVMAVTGVILLGVATPTESAGMGVLSAVILAAAYRSISWEMMKLAITETLKITIMIFIIVSAAIAFGGIVATTGATRAMAEFAMGLPLVPIAIVIAMMLIIVVLGMFLSSAVLMMLALPIFMPIIYTLGFDPIWFGVLFLINVQMGEYTPPFGGRLFIMQAVAPRGTTMEEIYKAGIPFLICDTAAIALIIAFPVLALWLPGLIFVGRT